MPTAAERWAADLAGWAVPDEILAQAPEPPWGFLPGMFEPPAEAADTPARTMALELLDDGGTLLDVGCGAGAASVALVPPASAVVGVDEIGEHVERFVASCRGVGVEATGVVGRWPDVATWLQPADVVVCHHVAYNVPDLVEFVQALGAHARRGVVLETAARHPMLGLRPLWQRFWGIDRPTGPTVEDLLAVVREAGIDVEVVRSARGATHWRTAGDLVRLTRKRLCLTPDRDAEIEEALAELPPADDSVYALRWRGTATT